VGDLPGNLENAMPVPNDWPPFPLFEMTEDGQSRLCSMQEAGVLLNSMWSKVEIGRFAVEADRRVRPITDAEQRQMSVIADRVDSEK
jgi:hypothetical protein